MSVTVPEPSALLGLAGTDLGTSSWLEVSQAAIDGFADATGDHQWIHTDVERAKDGPFGGTVAHGYLTLSMVIPLWSELLVVERRSLAVNYGLNRVRFPAPVPAGSRIRARGVLAEVDAVKGGVQLVADLTIECDAQEKPVCVAQAVFRFYD